MTLADIVLPAAYYAFGFLVGLWAGIRTTRPRPRVPSVMTDKQIASLRDLIDADAARAAQIQAEQQALSGNARAMHEG